MNRDPRKLFVLILGLFCLVAALNLRPNHSAKAALTAAACAPPKIVDLRGGILAELDQCYKREVEVDGTTYDILVYFTEDDTPQLVVDGAVQCTDDPNDPDDQDRCEHALPDSDIPGTDLNEWVLRLATQAELALPFYLERGFPMIDPETVFEIWVGEDPENGGVKGPNILRLDDEVALDTLMRIRGNVFHESQHLIQDKYDQMSGFRKWFGEGIAESSPDHGDPDYDALLSSRFLGRIQQVITDDDDYRSSDLLTISYRAVAFWTWFMDRYKLPAETEPGIGWNAILGYYTVLENSTDSLQALDMYLKDEQNSSFFADFLDYTLTLYAYVYDPDDPRLTYLDQELNLLAVPLGGHTVITGNQIFGKGNATLQPRSSKYWEYIPPNTCQFVSFTFDENNNNAYAFSVMTVDTSSKLRDRWSSFGSQWARTVNTSDLSRVVGVVTALDGEPDGVVQVGHGCVTPSLEIKSPTSGAPVYVGTADNPRQFQVRLSVNGQDGSAVAGLTKDDFTVTLLEPGGGDVLPGGVLTAAYVGDDYWLNVQAPYDTEGAQTGAAYDLRVTLANAISDTQNESVIYEERVVDKLIVLDKSGSMADDGRIEAARNAAVLMAAELAAIDQGAYIRYGSTAQVVNDLGPMAGTKLLDMILAINTTNPGGDTSIGDALQKAALQHDLHGQEDNYCVIALLSDGYENTAPFWADVAGDVTDNNCYMDVVGLGETANEALLEEISESSSAGGNYDFAQTAGGVPIDPDLLSGSTPAAVSATLSWENNLSRIYDAIVTRASGRQRLLGGVGQNQPGGDPAKFVFKVDPTSDVLQVAVAWQSPTVDQNIILFDPDGVPLPKKDHQTVVASNTAEIWRVPKPQAGNWTLQVLGVQQQFYVSASARTLLELQLYTGVPSDNPLQGVKVPIVATLSGDNAPVVGADVRAVDTNPAGQQKTFQLYDDGLDADMEAGDGVYGGWYTQTTGGETMVGDPTSVKEGQEPESRGSYLVSAAAVWQGLRREAQTSFFLYEAEDNDGDRLPDWWEEEHGLDSNNPLDGSKDPDGDGLPSNCEWNQGTDPSNPDTDGGGESDGSEMPECKPGAQDPLDPDDDRLEPVQAVFTTSEATASGQPYVQLWLAGLPEKGFNTADIYRRPANDPAAPWTMVGNNVNLPNSGQPFSDRPPFPGPDPQYRVVPKGRAILIGNDTLGTETALVNVTGRILTTSAVPLSSDPYPPAGSIIIAEGGQTSSRKVTLLLAAVDNGASSDGADEPVDPPPGTPLNKLQMRLSTNPDFVGANWRPFQSEVDNFDLGPVQDGEYVTVYVQFRDEAGNVSAGGDESTTIQFVSSAANDIFLPVIMKGE